MAISITGLEAELPRASYALPGWPAPTASVGIERSRLRELFTVGADHPPLALISEAYRRFGTSLRGLADAGWCRYSGHPDNFLIDGCGRALLIDLDSCRPTSGLSARLRTLEEVRDGMSGLYNLACSFFREDVMAAVSDDDLLSNEPFGAFLEGWDPGGGPPSAQDGQAIAEYVVKARQRLRRFGAGPNTQDALGAELYRLVRHDRDLTFAWLFRMAYRRRAERPHAAPVPWSLEELDERLLRFAGRPRFDALHELERR